jgi:hypothetical protein
LQLSKLTLPGCWSRRAVGYLGTTAHVKEIMLRMPPLSLSLRVTSPEMLEPSFGTGTRPRRHAHVKEKCCTCPMFAPPDTFGEKSGATSPKSRHHRTRQRETIGCAPNLCRRNVGAEERHGESDISPPPQHVKDANAARSPKLHRQKMSEIKSAGGQVR